METILIIETILLKQILINDVNLENDIKFLGKDRLKKIKEEGVTRKLMGVQIEHDSIDMYCEKTLFDADNNIIGYVRSATYSPIFKWLLE